MRSVIVDTRERTARGVKEGSRLNMANAADPATRGEGGRGKRCRSPEQSNRLGNYGQGYIGKRSWGKEGKVMSWRGLG